MTLRPAATAWSRTNTALFQRNLKNVLRTLCACLFVFIGSWSTVPTAAAGDHDNAVANVVRQFPDAAGLPGAHSVIRRETPGAVRCLIHIRDFHDTPETAERGRRVVQVVQEDIVQIIESLIRQQLFPFAGIHAEGVVREETLNENGNARDRIRQIVEQEMSNKLQAGPAPVRRPSALDRVHHRFGLALYPAEFSTTYSAALHAARNVHSNVGSRTRILLSDREDALLKIVAQAESPIAVAVYGGGHDWSDNIAVWNRRRPTEKFSLIEITPRAYQWCVVDGKNIASLRNSVEKTPPTVAIAQANRPSDRQ